MKSRNAWKFWTVVFALSAGILAATCVHFRVEQTRCAYRIMELQKEYAKWYEVVRRLEIERTRLCAPARLRRLARARFGLKPPTEDRLWTLVDPQ